MPRSRIISIVASLLTLAFVSSSCQRVLPPNSLRTESSAQTVNSEQNGSSMEDTPNVSIELNNSNSTANSSSSSNGIDESSNSGTTDPEIESTRTSEDSIDSSEKSIKETTKDDSKSKELLETQKLSPSEIKAHIDAEEDSYNERLINSIFGLDKDTNKGQDGTIHEPHEIGETAYFDGTETLFDPFKAEVKIQEVYRGDEALKMVKDTSIFNPEPEKGKEYLVAQVLVKVTTSRNQEVVGLSPYYFSLASGKDGRIYGDVTLIRNITPVLSPIEEGQTSIGYICFSVDKEDDSPYIVFLSRANGGIWFQTTEDSLRVPVK